MGVLAVGVGKVEDALPFFRTALEVNSSIAQYWLSYIDALIKLDRMTDAKAVFDQAKSNGAKGDGFDQLEKGLAKVAQVEGDQTDEEILEKAIGLRESGKYEEAIDLLLHEEKQSPTDPNLLALLSHCYILSDNLEQAKIYLDLAKNINPKIAAVGWNETRLLVKQKKVNEALALAKKANKLFPDDVEGIVTLGSCLRANGSFDESLKYLNKAIELNANYAEALINRGLIYLNKEDKANALTDLEKAHILKPHIKQIWHLVLNLKMEAEDFENTIALAEEMVKLDPVDEKIFSSIALCYHHLNNYDQAVTSYNEALSIKPDFAEAYNNMAVALKEQGKIEEAIEAYTKALSINPDYADAYNNLGNALKHLGKIEEATEAFNKALSIKPDYTEAYYNIGNALKVQGKQGEAIEAYKKVLSLKPDYADAYYELAAILYEQGDSSGVMENLGHVNLHEAQPSSDNNFLRLPYQILTSLKYNEMENVVDLKKSKGVEKSNKFPLIVERSVEDKLIKCLYKLSARSLDETKDARYGSGKCSPDFKLFETDEPIIKKVAAELLQSMEKLLDGTVLYHESFFNILGAGGGSKPHAHLKEQDLDFDLDKYKFSLVYYLSVGDQNCTEPGTLKLYEPDIDILPTKGMCVLIPASRKHSAIYNGSKDRMMIGCNFYLV